MAASAPKSVERIETILLSEVFFDPTWNARSAVGDNEAKDGPDETANSFDALCLSIESRGQDDAITVRKTPKDVKSKKPYMAVTGHRRGAAIAKIAEKTGDKSPTIKVVVKDLTELQARSLNIRENTSRDTLEGADIMFGVGEMFRLFPEATDSSIAAELGLSQNYVSRLHRIATKVRKDIQEHWRGALGTKLSSEALDKIGRLAHDEQRKAYDEACQSKRSAGKPGADAWKDRNREASERAGTLLAKLVKGDFVKITDMGGFFDAGEEGGLRLMVKYDKKADEKTLSRFAAAAQKAYEKELKRADDAPEVSANGAPAQN